MKPVRLWGKDYAAFKSVDWSLPEGVTAVLGSNDADEGISSNGSGKSTLLNLLPIALFGPALPWSEYVTAGGEETVEVGCEFEHQDETYRVRRAFSPKGRGKSELHFEILTGEGGVNESSPARRSADVTSAGMRPDASSPASTSPPAVNIWMPLSRESQAETQALIVLTLGLTEDTFSHSVFAHQGARHFADPNLAPRERKEILAQALGLGVYDQLLELCRVDIREAEKTLTGIAAQLEALGEDTRSRADLQDDLEAQQGLVTVLSGRATEASERLATAKTAYEQGRDARGALKAHQELLEARERSLRALEAQIRSRREDEESKRQHLIAERERLIGQAQTEQARSRKLATEAAAFKTKAEVIRKQIEEPPEQCDRCGQAIQNAAGDKFIASLERDAAVVEERALQMDTEAREMTAEISALVGRADEIVIPEPVDPRNLTSEEVEQHALLEGDVQVAQRRLGEAEAALPSDEAVKLLAAEVVAQEVEESNARRALAEAQTDLGRAQAALERLAEVEARQTSLTEQKGTAEDRLGLLHELEKAYGRDGIPALIMESAAIPKIEAEAERVLDRLGVPFRVELRTQAALKTSDRLKETLDVIVHTPEGERRYETFSGGERSRVNVALRIALARLLAHRRGAQIEVFCLDEVEHLDSAGVARLAELLKELSAEIPVVLLVSHVEQLSDAFDQQVLVEKTGGESRLVAA